MTAVIGTAAAFGGLAALVLLLRARVTTARRRTHATVDAVRAQLNLPADRCRLVDVSLRESLTAALHPWQRLPRFEQVHQVPRADRLAARKTR